MQVNIKQFVSEQTIEYSANINGQLKTVRRLGDVNNHFGDNDYMSFEDTAETIFLKVDFTENVLKIAKTIDLKVYRNEQLVDLNKENFHVVREIVSAIVSFFVYGSWGAK